MTWSSALGEVGTLPSGTIQKEVAPSAEETLLPRPSLTLSSRPLPMDTAGGGPTVPLPRPVVAVPAVPPPRKAPCFL